MTTPMIAERANVSRGAQTHHFPTKIELTVAAVDFIAERRWAEIGDLLTTIDESEDGDGQGGVRRARDQRPWP
jgi:AcrR family transcriptional regulator